MAEDAAATPCIQPLVPAERTTDEILVHFHSLTQTHLIGRSSQAASVIIVKPVHYYFVVQHSTAARHLPRSVRESSIMNRAPLLLCTLMPDVLQAIVMRSCDGMHSEDTHAAASAQDTAAALRLTCRTLRAAINNAVKQLTMRATSSEDINQAAKRFPGVNCIQQTVQKTQACTSLQATLLIV